MGGPKRRQKDRHRFRLQADTNATTANGQLLEGREAIPPGSAWRVMMMSQLLKPDQEILRARIRFALRRATGFVFDIDAMLRKPELRSRRIGLWRDVASDELSSLLDQLETEFQADSEDDDAERTVVIRRPEAESARR